MIPHRRALGALALLLSPLGANGAAQDDALELADLRQRLSYEHRLRHLARRHLATAFERAPLDRVARDLGRTIGVPILVSRGVRAGVASGALPRITLRLPRGPARTVLSALRWRAGVRFVHRGRHIEMLLPEEFHPRITLRVVPVRHLTFPIRDFIPRTRFGLRGSNDPEVEREEPRTRPVSGFDEEGLVDLVRKALGKKAWEVAGLEIESAPGLLLVRQTPRGHVAVARFLRRL